MFNKKTLKIISVAAISSSLLTGCFSNERDTIVANAKKEYAIGNYDKAREYFEQAKRMQDFSDKEADLTQEYQDSVNQSFTQYLNKGNSQFESKNFAEAVDNYEKAYALFSEHEELKLSLPAAKALLNEQNSFDKYLDFINPMITDSNVLLRSFNKDIDARVVGSLSQADFISHLKTLIPKSSDIIARVDDGFTSVDGDLSPIHQILLDLIQFQHRTFVMALQGATTQDLAERYITIKQKQTQLIQSLQDYANQKQIGYKMPTTEKDKDVAGIKPAKK
ncbi:tetratricopeptide repeat protein [Bacillus thuringiensis]|uniref:tetratricopeptide repeat protein n=1 Tax=Bacillus thuringiensis TaxID=1428 RepID=UPI0021D65D18|nr:tetratricopeptide repeat protein [Bacillus thuringiensis]MCU7666760.1 tetratricopeptide repeat protein [Bacillus thuringiensis]